MSSADIAIARRKIQREAFLAERLLDALEQMLAIDVRGVDLVDDDQPVESALLRVLHEAAGHHLDAVLGVDDDRRGLDGIEGTDRLTDEIGKSGRVDDVHTRVLALQVKNRGAQRMLPGSFERLEVADRRPALDAAYRLDRPRFLQQRLGERRLARCAVPDQRQCANVGGGEFRHE